MSSAARSPSWTKLTAEHTAQPDRQGLRTLRAGVHRRPRHRTRSAGGDRRGVRAPRVLGSTHIPMATLPGMAERTLTISSGGKTFNTTGWKVGWAWTGADGCRDPYRQAVPDLRQRCSVPAGDRGRIAAARRVLRRRCRRPRGEARPAVRGLVAAGFTAYRPEATYFTTVDIRPLRADGDGMAFCRSLPHLCGVVAVPNQVFYARTEYGRHLVRFARRKRLDVIDDAVAGRRSWRRSRREHVAGGRRPARHRVERPRRELRAAGADDRGGGWRRRRAGGADRDVLDRVRVRSGRLSARPRVVRRRSSSPRWPRSTGCGSAVRAPGGRAAPPTTTSALRTRSCSPAPAVSRHRYRKIHPFSHAGEERHVRAGTDLVTVDVEGFRVSMFVCYDLRFADEFWATGAGTDLATSCRPSGPRSAAPTGWRCSRPGPSRTRRTSSASTGWVRATTSRTPATAGSSIRSASCWPPRATPSRSCSPTSPPTTSHRPGPTSASSKTAAAPNLMKFRCPQDAETSRDGSVRGGVWPSG